MVFVAGGDNAVELANNTGVKFIEQILHNNVVSINRQRVLREIVGAYADEICTL